MTITAGRVLVVLTPSPTVALIALVLVIVVVVLLVLRMLLPVALAVERATTAILLEAAIRALAAETAASLVTTASTHVAVAATTATSIRPSVDHRPSAAPTHNVPAARIVVVSSTSALLRGAAPSILA